MKKFEYTQIYLELAVDGLNHIEKMNDLGKNGWELIHILNMDGRNICYYFKREMKEKTLLTEGETNE